MNNAAEVLKAQIEEVTTDNVFGDEEKKEEPKEVKGWQYADISQWLSEAPPARQWIFNDLLPRSVVGQIAARGGTGKTFLLMAWAISLACGVRCFKSFTPAEPMSVLALFGEDPPDEIWRRFASMVAALDLSEVETALLKKNLHIIAGYAHPLMQALGRDPQPSFVYDKLVADVIAHKPGVVFVDPQSRFYGLDENNNSEAAFFIARLQDIATEHDCSIILAHHVSKAGQETRGATAFRDGARWACEMSELTEETAGKAGMNPDYAWRYVSLTLTKSSYAPKGNRVLYFERGEGGTLTEIEPRADMLLEVARTIADKISLMGLRPTSKEITMPLSGKTALRDEVVREHPNASRQVLHAALTEGVRAGILRVEGETRGNHKTAKVYLPGSENHA